MGRRPGLGEAGVTERTVVGASERLRLRPRQPV